MKFIKIFLTSLCLIITTVANADVASQALNKVSEKISNLIPGEGITEVSLDYNDGDEDQLNFSILGVRDIEATDNSNFFTQFSLMNQEINSSGRIIGNIGLGYRKLSEDKNFMFGAKNASDSHFQSREALALPFTLDPTAIPTVTIAFSTAGALTVHEADSCDGQAVMYATPPDSTITIQGQ